MSKTSFGELSPLARRAWSREILIEAERASFFDKFTGKDPETSMIVEVDDLEKEHGCELTLAMLHQLPDDAVCGDERLSGKAHSLEFSYENIRIKLTRNAVAWETIKSGQLAPYDIRKLATGNLGRWKSRMMDTAVFNHLAGNTLANGSAFGGGNNPICGPSENRICYPKGHECEDTINDDPSAVMTLKRITQASHVAQNLGGTCNSGTMRPIRQGGREFYVMFLSDEDAFQLQCSDKWCEVQTAAMAGGDIENNPLFTGALGRWNNVILHQHSRLPNGISKETCKELCNVKRSVLAGAGALTLAHGGVEGSKGMWTEEVSDHDKCKEVGYSCMWGVKKNRYQPEQNCEQTSKFADDACDDYATLVLPSYAPGFKEEAPKKKAA